MTTIAREAIMALADRACGVTAANLVATGRMKFSTAWVRLHYMAGAGHLHRADADGHCAHWFATRALADAWRAAPGEPDHVPVHVLALRHLQQRNGRPLTAAELARETGCKRDSAGSALRGLCREGRAVGRKAGEISIYFLTAAAADGWRGTIARARKAPRKATGLLAADKPVRPAACKPVVPKLAPPTVVITPDHVRVVRCPSVMHDPRYQCAPGELVRGAGFAAAGIGRGLDGRPWGSS